jgi:hypothetical protein
MASKSPSSISRAPRHHRQTKKKKTYWAAQEGLSDPKATLKNHFLVNPAGQDTHVFAWKHPTKGMCSLSKAEFLKWMASAALAANLPSFKGHSLSIGGTLEYRLCGIPFDVIKSMGRWSSESFTLYLQQHAMILAPYIQATQYSNLSCTTPCHQCISIVASTPSNLWVSSFAIYVAVLLTFGNTAHPDSQVWIHVSGRKALWAFTQNTKHISPFLLHTVDDHHTF